MGEVDDFLANFQILGPLGSQGWVVLPQNVGKKSNILYIYFGKRGRGGGGQREGRGATVHKMGMGQIPT